MWVIPFVRCPAPFHSDGMLPVTAAGRRLRLSFYRRHLESLFCRCGQARCECSYDTSEPTADDVAGREGSNAISSPVSIDYLCWFASCAADVFPLMTEPELSVVDAVMIPRSHHSQLWRRESGTGGSNVISAASTSITTCRFGRRCRRAVVLMVLLTSDVLKWPSVGNDGVI